MDVPIETEGEEYEKGSRIHKVELDGHRVGFRRDHHFKEEADLEQRAGNV